MFVVKLANIETVSNLKLILLAGLKELVFTIGSEKMKHNNCLIEVFS